MKIASLSFTFGFNGLPYPNGQTWRAGKLDAATIIRKAKEARDQGAEIVVVSCHWGTEYSSKLNDQQRELAPQLLADSNIDLVIGHHAHVVQPMEQINGKWVAYGLGNLVAAHREPNSIKAEGLLVRFTFTRDGDRWKTEQAEYAPLLMTDALPVRVLDVRRELAKADAIEAEPPRAGAAPYDGDRQALGATRKCFEPSRSDVLWSAHDYVLRDGPSCPAPGRRGVPGDGIRSIVVGLSASWTRPGSDPVNSSSTSGPDSAR